MARIVSSGPLDTSTTDLLHRLDWSSVQYWLKKKQALWRFKFLDALAFQYVSDFFIRLPGRHSREIRNTKTDLAVPLMSPGNGQKSFAYRGASLWTSLDLDIKVSLSTNVFKSKLKKNVLYVHKEHRSLKLYDSYASEFFISFFYSL